MSFKEIRPDELKTEPFKLLDKGWALLSAGKEDSFNTMTVSWGAMGTIWGQPAATVYVRPQRYTKEFIDREKTFTLCFFDEEYKKDLGYLGKVSGRNEDKLSACSLSPCFCKGEDAPVFKEAKLVLVCRKMFAQYMDPEKITDSEVIPRWYPDSDFHTLYIGAVEKVFVK